MNDVGANSTRQKVEESRRVSEKRILRMPILSTITILLCMILPVTILNQNVCARIWEPKLEISTDTLMEDQWNVSMVADGDRVHVVWENHGNVSLSIYYRWFDGIAWQPEQKISPVASWGQMGPSLAVNGDKVHVVWQDNRDLDNDIYYKQFDGVTWQPEQEISSDAGMEDQTAPSIAVDGDMVYVAWGDNGDGDWDIYYRHFDGVTWQPEQEISADPGTAKQNYPIVAVDAGRVHVLWRDDRDGRWNVYYRCFDGVTWQPELKISSDISEDIGIRQYSIAVDGDRVYVVWGERRPADNDWDVYYKYFDGIGWQPELDISMDSGTEGQWWPSIAVNEGKVHVVWTDYVEGDADIYYRHFDGTSWQPKEEVSTDAGAELQWGPSIAVGTGAVHVVWIDGGDGDWDVYYTRSTEDITPPQSSVNPISPYWQTTTTFDVDWIATDDQDLANISLYYRYSSNNVSWFPWKEWDYNNSITGMFATGLFPFDAVDGDGFYEFYTIARDSSGNNEMPPLSADSIVGVDTNPPTGSIVINDGDEWTTSTSVALTLTYFDSLSGVDQVRYSNDGLWDGEPWEDPSSTKTWTLPSGDGTKTVYYQVRDNAGLLSMTYLDDINLDTTPPVGSIDINSGDIWTASPWVALSLTYSDATSGVDQVRYSNDGVWDDESWELPSTNKEWPLSFGDGVKTVYYQIKDNAGLLSNTYSDIIGLDTEEPMGSIVIDNGNEWTNSTAVMLTLGYSDTTSGVLEVRYSNDGVWDSEVWEDPSMTRSWTIADSDGVKFVYYQTRDAAGIESMTYLDHIGLDTTPPTGSVNVNNGDGLTSSTSVTLSLAYWDSFSGVAEIRLGNDGIWDTEAWEPPSMEKSWLLPSGDGTKTVHYQIKDNAGLISETYTDDIELDTTPPTIVNISPLNGATGVEISTNIEVTFSERMDQSATADSFSLVKGQTEVEGIITWTTDGRTMFFIPTEHLEYNTTYQIIILTGARDVAGNTMAESSETLFTTKDIEEESPGAIDYWWIILVLVIILLIIALILMARRKRSQIEEEVLPEEENHLEVSEASQSNNINVTPVFHSSPTHPA